MEISHRHHYIPQFLIQNFADEDGKLWVYNKIDKRIAKNKQSPKSVFFELDRNLFEFNGNSVDNIEKLYAEFDNYLSACLTKVLSTHAMTGSEQTLIIFLVAMMKWRVPKADSKFYSIVKEFPLEKLGAKIRRKDLKIIENDKELELLKNSEIIEEMKRLLLPIQPLISENNLKEIHDNCFIVSYDKFPALIGDCPIIESMNDKIEVLEDFIFPLSTNDTFIYKKDSKCNISSPLFYIQKDLAVFHLSEKYVACKSKEQLEKIIEIYSKLEKENKLHFIIKYVFNYID
jgi:hypothetical protein